MVGWSKEATDDVTLVSVNLLRSIFYLRISYFYIL